MMNFFMRSVFFVDESWIFNETVGSSLSPWPRTIRPIRAARETGTTPASRRQPLRPPSGELLFFLASAIPKTFAALMRFRWSLLEA